MPVQQTELDDPHGRIRKRLEDESAELRAYIETLEQAGLVAIAQSYWSRLEWIESELLRERVK